MNKILVLNMDSAPIMVMPFDRGFRLAYKGKADVVSYVEDKPIKCNIADEDYLSLINTCPSLLNNGDTSFKRPTIIRLKKYVFIPFKKVSLSRHNLYRRDAYKCVYCGSKDNLTIDHVKPKSKGGKNSWENLVTCCGTCNVTKGDRPLDEFLLDHGYTLDYEPYRPTYIEFLSNHKHIHKDWTPYVYV